MIDGWHRRLLLTFQASLLTTMTTIPSLNMPFRGSGETDTKSSKAEGGNAVSAHEGAAAAVRGRRAGPFLRCHRHKESPFTKNSRTSAVADLEIATHGCC